MNIFIFDIVFKNSEYIRKSELIESSAQFYTQPITSIGLFYECTKLSPIEFIGDVISIRHLAFESCTNLASITIPENVESIGERAFEYCTSLTSTAISSQITFINDCLFVECTKLSSIEFLGDVISNRHLASESCTNLTSITIPENVESIGIVKRKTISSEKLIGIVCGSVGGLFIVLAIIIFILRKKSKIKVFMDESFSSDDSENNVQSYDGVEITYENQNINADNWI